MEHVVAADLVRAVREAVGVPVVGRFKQQLGGVGGAARCDDDVRSESLFATIALDDDLCHGRPHLVGLQSDDLGIRQQ